MADLAQDFRVRLTDGAGLSASVRVSDVSGALFFPPGSTGPVPKVVLNTVRIPLSAFGGINLTNVRSVQFTFDERLQGAVLITDVAFGVITAVVRSLCFVSEGRRAQCRPLSCAPAVLTQSYPIPALNCKLWRVSAGRSIIACDRINPSRRIVP